MNIYVGNLSYDVQENDLKQLFGQFGSVVSVKVVTDGESGRSRGFGFVEMGSQAEGEDAVAGLDGSEFAGRRMVVSPARPKREDGRHGGNRDGYSGDNRGKRPMRRS